MNTGQGDSVHLIRKECLLVLDLSHGHGNGIYREGTNSLVRQKSDICRHIQLKTLSFLKSIRGNLVQADFETGVSGMLTGVRANSLDMHSVRQGATEMLQYVLHLDALKRDNSCQWASDR